MHVCVVLLLPQDLWLHWSMIHWSIWTVVGMMEIAFQEMILMNYLDFIPDNKKYIGLGILSGMLLSRGWVSGSTSL